MSYLIIGHDLQVTKALPHEVIVMRNGEMVEYIPSDRIFSYPQNSYTKSLMAAAFSLDSHES
ncbi:hypothetical protein GCM10023262_09560 [Bartonella pachyuromydis]|uniref:Uncharacterized protein n=1 Tax=Bartonella pachyuromydis TaxID=931097 RepID=A0ABP8VHC3_9HYPH